MRLLVDHNLSYKIAVRLGDRFPGSLHVGKAGLSMAPDKEIWEYAKKHDFCILTKDTDFNFMSRMYGFPPKVIWIKIGNCSVDFCYELLIKYELEIKAFDHSEAGLLILHAE